jgi:hypothetical protein
MPMDPGTRTSLLSLLILTFALTSLFYGWSFSGAPVAQVAPLLMWMPGVAAIITQLMFYRTIEGLGWRPGSWSYLALAVVLPIGCCLAIYVPVWMVGLGRFDGTYLGRILPFLRSRWSRI